MRGRAEWTDDHTLYISELPVGKWTQDYKNYLCELIQQGKLVSSFKENHTDTEVSFTVTVREEDAKQLHENMDKTMKEFRLTSMLRYVLTVFEFVYLVFVDAGMVDGKAIIIEVKLSYYFDDGYLDYIHCSRSTDS